MYRIGNGFDTHALKKSTSTKHKLILGGVQIPFNKFLVGHSDADVLLHAVIDALIGAVGLGDIGVIFPNTDKAYKGADSKRLLNAVMRLVGDKRYKVVSIDSTIICQQPLLSPYIPSMRRVLEAYTNCKAVNVKATTTEKMNAEGEGKCISAMAVVLIKKRRLFF